AYCHIGHPERPGKPPVPAAVVIQLKTRIDQKVAVEKRKQGERCRMNRVRGIDGADLVEMLPAGPERIVAIRCGVRGHGGDLLERALGLVGAIDAITTG